MGCPLQMLEVIKPHLCMNDRDVQTPLLRRLSRTRAALGCQVAWRWAFGQKGVALIDHWSTSNSIISQFIVLYECSTEVMSSLRAADKKRQRDRSLSS